ncbi:hypothetical protein [Streptomyces phaeofaciens]|uniref:hypothetical protein n=1 Tax=Streptomyces phaeofaciens TaxID=68254 RepID=UPI0036C9A797
MSLFTSRRKPRLSLALDDIELDRTLKALREPPSSRAITDLQVARISDLVKQAGKDADRRCHRLAVLADTTAFTRLPASWISRDPQSGDALLLHVWAQLAQGKGVGKLKNPQEIIEFCYRAAELNPRDLSPWLAILGVARLERYARNYVLTVWREVSARDRWNREAHLHMLDYLSPEECGSRMEMLEFIDTVHARTPANAATAALELTSTVRQYHGIVRRGGVEALMARDFWEHGPALQVLNRAAELWPEQGFLEHAAAMADLNLLAYALVAAERHGEAARIFVSLEGKVTSWPWGVDGDPVETFTRAQARSLRRAK